MKAKLVILRHGQTEYNKNHLMTGQVDAPLTSVGEDQGREAGRQMAGIVFDKAYSSTLSRAFNTAALALGASGSNAHLKNPDGSFRVQKDIDIIEGDTGDFTGRNHKTDPVIISFGRTYDMPMPNGESDKQVVERVRKFFDREVMPRLLKGENVLVVAHAGVLRAFDIVLGLEPEPAAGQKRQMKRIENAAPTLYEYEEGKLASFRTLGGPPPADAANQNGPHVPRKSLKP